MTDSTITDDDDGTLDRFNVDVGGETYTVWQLAHLADCGSPDDLDSAGAIFLRSVASAADEIIDTYREEKTPEDRYDYDSEIHQAADNAPDVYTHQRWLEFVDLAAYQENLDDLGGTSGDMERDAGVALYIIAERLLHALVEAAGPFDNEDETDDDDSEVMA